MDDEGWVPREVWDWLESQRSGRVLRPEWPDAAELAKKYETLTGRMNPHTTVHDSTVHEIGTALHRAVEEMTEGQTAMTMTRQQLVELQNAAARQLADAQAQLARYEHFPTQDEVLAKGTVIRFTVKRTNRENVPVAVAHFDGESFPRAGEISFQHQLREVTHTYDYVALYVNVDGGQWYITGVRGRERYTYDELLRFMVDGGVERFEVLEASHEFPEAPATNDTDDTGDNVQVQGGADTVLSGNRIGTQAMDVKEDVSDEVAAQVRGDQYKTRPVRDRPQA